MPADASVPDGRRGSVEITTQCRLEPAPRSRGNCLVVFSDPRGLFASHQQHLADTEDEHPIPLSRRRRGPCSRFGMRQLRFGERRTGSAGSRRARPEDLVADFEDTSVVEPEDGTDLEEPDDGGLDDLAAAPDTAFASAPSCMHLSQYTYKSRSSARVSNKCSYSVRARMIWTYALDGVCRTYLPGGQAYESRDVPIWTPYVTQLRRC